MLVCVVEIYIIKNFRNICARLLELSNNKRMSKMKVLLFFLLLWIKKETQMINSVTVSVNCPHKACLGDNLDRTTKIVLGINV